MKYAVITCNDAKKWGYSESTARRIIKVFSKSEENWAAFHAVRGDVPKVEELEKFQAFILSGSASSVNENKEWMLKLEDFIRKAAKFIPRNNNCRPKLIGLCFGHQLIAKALGGKVGLNPSGEFVLQTEEIKPFFKRGNVKEEGQRSCKEEEQEKDHKEEGGGEGKEGEKEDEKKKEEKESVEREEEINQKQGKGKLFKELFKQGSFQILQSHGECVTELPKDAVTLGTSRSCENEIILFTENILGVQCHPDVTCKDAENLILPAISNKYKWSEEKIKQARESLGMDVDAEKVIHAIRAFINE